MPNSDVASNEETKVSISPKQEKISYKTRVEFIDAQRGKRDIVSVQAPTITPFGSLQFLMDDRLVNFPLSVVFSWSTEQLCELIGPKIII